MSFQASPLDYVFEAPRTWPTSNTSTHLHVTTDIMLTWNRPINAALEVYTYIAPKANTAQGSLQPGHCDLLISTYAKTAHTANCTPRLFFYH